MKRKSSSLVTWAQYLLARSIAATALTIDADVSVNIAAVVGRVLHRMHLAYRQRAALSISRCFPEYEPEEVERLTRASLEHAAQLVVEVVHSPRIIHADSWAQRLNVTDMSSAIQLLNRGKPVILLTGHLGNWELLGYVLAVMDYRIHAIARPIDNPLINRWLLGIRQAKGMEVITKWDATDRMMEVIDAGEALAFIADQNAGDRGLFVPFFGQLASSYKSIGLLAIRKELPIICGYAHRIGPGCRYEMGTADVIQPHEWVDQPDPLFYVTARYNRAMEMMIRRRPAQYLWMHRRWKSRPRWERETKPMPAAVQRNLEALPWMTQAEMNRLIETSSQDFWRSPSPAGQPLPMM